MVLSLNESRRASLRQALLYARETFPLMPAHWLRPGVVADIETFLDELASKARHGQESKLGFPGSRDARRHVAKLLKATTDLKRKTSSGANAVESVSRGTLKFA
jgi:hypothetical protein